MKHGGCGYRVCAAFACALLACSDVDVAFDPADPGRGPGELAGDDQPLNEGFAGGPSGDPESANASLPADGALPNCGEACEGYCAGLALDNPLDAAACGSLWGVGLDTRPIRTVEACRRLYVDLVGRFPTRSEVRSECKDRDYGEVVAELMARPEFVEVAQRRWADLLLYNNVAMSVERIYDMDELVGRLYEGRVAYDEFAAVVSAHPVLTRRYDTPGDRAEALFNLFLGRPPYEHERADMAKLYVLWSNGYYDHPKLGQRLPDAMIEYRCVDEAGNMDPATEGECTSVLWGYNPLILTPDFRAGEEGMWSGLLRADEWQKLQLPGRIISSLFGFWEHAVSEVLVQYLGYDLGARVPAVRQALVQYVLQHGGDIRAAHYAVATSQVYLQSSTGSTPTAHRWTYGPLKQIEVEPWIDTVKRTTGYPLSRCDHRIPDPEQMLEGGFTGYSIVNNSRWELDGDEGVVTDYRDLARTLGGCPDNQAGGRFKTVSILTTATQEAFVTEVCNATLDAEGGADVAELLPRDMAADRALDADVAEQILNHQMGLFYSRNPSDTERQQARGHADACTPKPCTAESFARPLCYALLSSSEMLFY